MQGSFILCGKFRAHSWLLSAEAGWPCRLCEAISNILNALFTRNMVCAEVKAYLGMRQLTSVIGSLVRLAPNEVGCSDPDTVISSSILPFRAIHSIDALARSDQFMASKRDTRR